VDFPFSVFAVGKKNGKFRRVGCGFAGVVLGQKFLERA
jgi:hypothetical protein